MARMFSYEPGEGCFELRVEKVSEIKTDELMDFSFNILLDMRDGVFKVLSTTTREHIYHVRTRRQP